MELKKYPHVDLERQKTTFTLIGLVLSLFLAYMALEYSAAQDQEPPVAYSGQYVVGHKI